MCKVECMVDPDRVPTELIVRVNKLLLTFQARSSMTFVKGYITSTTESNDCVTKLKYIFERVLERF